MTYIIVITLLTYIGMIFFTKHRTSISFIGAGLLLIIGGLTGVFNAQQAFMKFPGDIVILIMVLSLFTDIFDRLGVINYIGYKFISISKENKVMIMIILPILMCVTSLFMNNLTVVLLFTYMSLYLCIEYRLPIIPALVSVIIGSNIGGAALPWADTPAVVITLYSNFNLIDFLSKLFVPCMVYSGLLAGYTYIWYKYFSPHDRYLPFREKPELNMKKVRFPLIVFVVYIISVSIAPFMNISIAFTSLVFGGIALIADGRDPMDILNSLPILDSLAFIIALFIMGGVLEYCGILTDVSNYVISLTNQRPELITLAVMILSFTISTFLSAGPASATLIPICAALSHLVPGKLIYAALALGILAGSSMLPWSATGGPILLSQTNKFLKEVKVDLEERKRISSIYNLKQYLMFSVPFSLIMLTISGVYLCIAVKIF